MGMCLAVILILSCVNQAITTQDEVNKSFLAIKEGCICPGHTVILECTIVATSTRLKGSIIVWSGTSFDCPSSANEINLLNNKFLNISEESGECNNGLVKAQILRIDPDEDNITYIMSQLNVTINSKNLGQTITCQYDDGTRNISTIDSINLTAKLLTDQFNPSEVNYSVGHNGSKRTITFTWNAFNTSKCPAAPYSILASGCGDCPTITNHTTVNCINVSTDVTYCTFALIPAICGGISPGLSVLLDVKLKGLNEGQQSNLIAACAILTIIVISLLILISTMLLFRFKDYIKKKFRFQFEFPISRFSVNLCTNQTRESEVQLQCHYTSQYEEIGIYSSVDKEDSDETNGSILKIFDNKNKEKGIYGIEDECGHHEVEHTAACQPQTSPQTVNSLSIEPATISLASLNLEDLLIKLDDEAKLQWYKLGEVIGVPRDYLDTLSGEEESQCLKTVLDYWLIHHPGQPTWDEVAKAQRKIKLLNQLELKDKAIDHAIDVPPPKPPRRRSSVNRSHSLIAPIKT